MMAPALALIRPMTWASLPALATKSTPVTPAAPLLFSTSTGWPRCGDMRLREIAAEDVGRPAGRKRHDQGERLAGKGCLRLRLERGQGGEAGQAGKRAAAGDRHWFRFLRFFCRSLRGGRAGDKG